MEPRTKSGKKEKLKIKTDMLRSIGKTVRGIRGVSPEEEKQVCGAKDLQNRKVLSLIRPKGRLNISQAMHV